MPETPLPDTVPDASSETPASSAPVEPGAAGDAPLPAAEKTPADRGATDEAEAPDRVADEPLAEEAAAPAPPRPAPLPDLPPAACATALAGRFPALFGTGRMLPIKLRIQADIQQRAPGVFTKRSLSVFLHRHTTSTPYIKALLETPHRFDLDGAPAGEVLPEHREAAIAEMERRRAVVQARRAAERDAQRAADRPGPSPTVAAPGGAMPAADAAAAPSPAPAPPPRRDRQPGAVRPAPPQAPRPRRPPRPPRPAPAARAHAPEGGPLSAPAATASSASPTLPSAPPAARPVAPGLPPAELEARRERFALLRAWESSTLTRSNFCVLKRISETQLEADLALARQERGPSAPPPATSKPPFKPPFRPPR